MTEDRGALALAERVLAILDEGSFSATYKFALFTAILDLCLERTGASGRPPDSLTTRQLAERVLELYWPHALPFGGHGPLRQGGVRRDQQAEIVARIVSFRARWASAHADTPHRARVAHPLAFSRLVDFVEWKLVEMPIPRLQVLGREEDRFLYEYHWDQHIRHAVVAAYQRGVPRVFDNRLLLKPGVSLHLVRLNSVLRPLFRREWALMVAGMNRLPQAELERFLFGVERVALDTVRRPLLDLQDGRCFYCDRRIAAAADVDHFLPWSRYPDDGLDNLVAAHPGCNASKRDFLAAAEHVERWRTRTADLGEELLAVAETCGWRRDDARTLAVARTLYLRLPGSVQLWQAPSRFVPLERDRIASALR
jgi:5-methylcytosine-specific restriction endonuclease McrA